MKRFILIALFLVPFLFPEKVHASKIDKAYHALSVFDYFKAKELFYSAMHKNPAAAAFGLATIYYRNDNPFHNYDSAYKYTGSCLLNYSLLQNEKKQELKRFGLSDSSIHRLDDSVFFHSYELMLRRSKRSNIEVIERFMSIQRRSPFLFPALNLRDSIVFARVFHISTSASYLEFILAYPESGFIPLAKNRLEEALFEESTASKLPVDYEKFILNFPKSPYLETAENGIFNYYAQKKDVSGLYAFLRKYPDNSNVPSAWKLIYTVSVPDYKPEALSSFLEKYPDFPFKENIQQEISLLNLELFSIKENNKFGFIDSSGTIYVACIFDGVEEFSEGLCAAELGGKSGFIGKTGAITIPFQFEDAESFKNGLAIVQYNGKACVIDRTGNFVASGYDDISDFNEGLAVVVKDGKQGVINRAGQLVIPVQYDKIGDFSGQVAYVLNNGKYGYTDRQGDLLISTMFEWAETFKNGMARVKYNGKFGVINLQGDFLLKPEYDHIEEPYGDIFVVVKGIYYGFADKSGCLLTEIRYQYSPKLKTADLTDGRWLRLIAEDYQDLAGINGKRLFGNENYEEVYLPKDGLSRIFSNDKYGYADEKNKIVIKPVYDEASDFDEGIAIVKKKEMWLLINMTNKTVFSAKADELENFGNKLFVYTINKKKGLLNNEGKTLIPPEYTEIEKVNNYLSRVYNLDKTAIYSSVRQNFVWKEKDF
ncbi:MAG: WG repeat-containing protein [Bacteroidia bacterium]